jgi:hypothetical protein
MQRRSRFDLVREREPVCWRFTGRNASGRAGSQGGHRAFEPLYLRLDVASAKVQVSQMQAEFLVLLLKHG